MWWSWLLTAVGVFGLYMAGRKVWWAWFIGLGAQTLWIVYAIQTEQYGFIVSAVAYGWVYGKNAYSWRLDALREKPLASGGIYAGPPIPLGDGCVIPKSAAIDALR